MIRRAGRLIRALLVLDIEPVEAFPVELRRANTRLLRRKGLARYRAARPAAVSPRRKS